MLMPLIFSLDTDTLWFPGHQLPRAHFTGFYALNTTSGLPGYWCQNYRTASINCSISGVSVCDTYEPFSPPLNTSHGRVWSCPGQKLDGLQLGRLSFCVFIKDVLQSFPYLVCDWMALNWTFKSNFWHYGLYSLDYVTTSVIDISSRSSGCFQEPAFCIIKCLS